MIRFLITNSIEFHRRSCEGWKTCNLIYFTITRRYFKMSFEISRGFAALDLFSSASARRHRRRLSSIFIISTEYTASAFASVAFSFSHGVGIFLNFPNAFLSSFFQFPLLHLIFFSSNAAREWS